MLHTEAAGLALLDRAASDAANLLDGKKGVPSHSRDKEGQEDRRRNTLMKSEKGILPEI